MACQLCNDTRHVLTDNGWKRCNCLKSLLFKSSKVAGEAEIYSKSTLEDFSVSPTKLPNENAKNAKKLAFTIIQRVTSDVKPKKSIIFTGPPFTGKTLLSSAVLNACAAQGKAAARVTLTQLKESYFVSSGKSEYYDFLAADILCIQIGADIINGASLPILFELFKERFNRGRYTFFTAVLKTAEMKAEFMLPLKAFLSNTDMFLEAPVR